jgi:hypothetical protein
MDIINRIASVDHRERGQRTELLIPAGELQLEATLELAPGARGIVALLHAASAERFSPRNLFAAQVLQQAGLATLQADLLTPGEEAAGGERPSEAVALLTSRIVAVVDWLTGESTTTHLSLGLFAGDTAAAAALAAAAERDARVAAVVLRGGGLDPAEQARRRHSAPALLIVPGFDEPEAMARGSELASEFFVDHLVEHPGS